MIAYLLVAVLALPAHGQMLPSGGDARRSGYEFMSRDTRAMQNDDATNPGTLWVLDGEVLWNSKSRVTNRACFDCHKTNTSMVGVAARYPAYDSKRGRPINLEQRVNLCRTGKQKEPEFPYESKDLLALTAYVGLQSRGLSIRVEEDARMQPFIDAGRVAFNRRQGQLNLSCAQCHEHNVGHKLAGNTIPEAHPNGYPVYRLEWQGVGSLQRRLRNCQAGIRAQLSDFGSDELVDMELFLMWRARGMKVETPAVRP